MRILNGWKRRARGLGLLRGRSKPAPAGRLQRERTVFERLSGFGAADMAVDLGSANTVVYLRGEGIVIQEPSVLAVDALTREVLSVGSAAAAMTGREPAGVELVYPVVRGAVTDLEAAAHLVQTLVGKGPGSIWTGPRVVVTTATDLSPVEIRAVLNCMGELGARKVVRLPATLAAAYGAELEKSEYAGLLVIDIGAGTTDLAVVDADGVVASRLLRTGAGDWDRAIAAAVAKAYDLRIGPVTAERLKRQVADLREGETHMRLCAGLARESGLPREVLVEAKVLRPALLPFADAIANEARTILLGIRAELREWIAVHGVLLVGGGALLRGLDSYLTHSLGLPVYVSEDALHAVAVGAGKTLAELDVLRDSMLEYGR